MINLEFFSHTYPIPQWQTIAKPLGDAELFLIETKSTKPGGLIYLRQEIDIPPYHLGLEKIYPDHDRYIIKMPIPAPLRTITGLERKLSYRLSDKALLYERGVNMLIARIINQ